MRKDKTSTSGVEYSRLVGAEVCRAGYTCTRVHVYRNAPLLSRKNYCLGLSAGSTNPTNPTLPYSSMSCAFTSSRSAGLSLYIPERSRFSALFKGKGIV